MRSPLGLKVNHVLTNNELYAPELFELEILSALRASVLRDEISLERAVTAMNELEDWGVVRVSHEGLLRPTWNYYRNVSPYDAIYLAVAADLGIGVITADSKLARAPIVDVAVYDVRDVNVLAWLETR